MEDVTTDPMPFSGDPRGFVSSFLKETLQPKVAEAFKAVQEGKAATPEMLAAGMVQKALAENPFLALMEYDKAMHEFELFREAWSAAAELDNENPDNKFALAVKLADQLKSGIRARI